MRQESPTDFLTCLDRIGITLHPGGLKGTYRLLHLLNPKEGERIIELGCGSGRTLSILARWSKAQIIGVDLMPNLVAKAREKVWSAPDRVSVCIADVCSLPFQDDAFDGAYAESVFVLVDKTRGLKEAWRVLKEGGRLVLLELTWKKAKMEQWNRQIAQLLSVPDYEVLTGPEWVGALEGAGFRVKRVELVDPFAIAPTFRDLSDEMGILSGLFRLWSTKKRIEAGKLLFWLMRYSYCGLYLAVKSADRR